MCFNVALDMDEHLLGTRGEMSLSNRDPGPDIARVRDAMREHDRDNPPEIPHHVHHDDGARSGVDEDPDGPELPEEIIDRP
jgi:hypothetical protein